MRRPSSHHPEALMAVLTEAAPRPRLAPFSWAWLGLIPFFLFALALIALPALTLFTGSFTDRQGAFTLENVAGLTSPLILNAYRNSVVLSLITAVLGGLIGFLLAYAVALGGVHPAVRTAILTFSGLAANFGGVPLAFSIIATIGRTGFVTTLLRDTFGLDLYRLGFNLYTLPGLVAAYLYFQLPLMILIMVPALESLKREWREAAQSLGASNWQYWRHVALPILTPTLLGTLILLFGNAFGAYATAQALTGGTITLVTIVIGAQIRGDVLNNPGLGYAMVLGMIAIMAICIAAYSALQRQAERWLK
jgi:putative spermidine/putrescine transport system permease protein